jgi:hypothetical protein
MGHSSRTTAARSWKFTISTPSEQRRPGLRSRVPDALRSLEQNCDVRFGSKAGMCGATVHVRFGPKADIDFPDVSLLPVGEALLLAVFVAIRVRGAYSGIA